MRDDSLYCVWLVTRDSHRPGSVLRAKRVGLAYPFHKAWVCSIHMRVMA